MKLTIFFEWICLQILSTQCDIFLNNLNASDVATKVCIQKTINHLFSYDDTLSLILDNDICEDAIFGMNTTRPYMSFNRETVGDIQWQYERQFIICPTADANSLKSMIRKMNCEIKMCGNSKILVITNTIDPYILFYIFWRHGFNNVIVLFYGPGISKLSMSDRYSRENGCGKTAKSIIYQNCEDQVTFSFTNVIHQMNKCPITFLYAINSVYEKEMEHPPAGYIVYVIKELSNRCNATFQRLPYKWEVNLSPSNLTNIVVMVHCRKKLHGDVTTKSLVEMDIVWFVPKAEQISNMDAILKVFSCNVWVAVGVTLICVSLSWFVIISWNTRFTFEKLGLAFINVWSLTICGCIAQFPRSFALRITLLSYLFYVIHIQCAFTSNMATILTTPRYGFQIRNLEELAESGLPIYIINAVKVSYFNLNDTNHTLYTRLQKQLHPVSQPEFTYRLLNFNLNQNYAFILSAEDLRNTEKIHSQKFHVYSIQDNSMTGAVVHYLHLPIQSYFIPTINSLLSDLAESGIGDKVKNDIEREYHPKNVSMQENDEELTLPHLAFIFIFLGLGLSISCVVFCLEHVVHKFF